MAETTRRGSAGYDPVNVLDRLSRTDTLELHYRHMMERERELLARRLALRGGEVLSVGAGWHPGRHLFPAPAFRLTAADADPAKVAGALAERRADAGQVGWAGRLGLPPASFDVVLYRLVLHHIVDQQPLGPVFREAAALLRPGGALVAIEPGRRHPVGAALAVANRVGLGVAMHGTPDDIPLPARRLTGEARAAGLVPEVHAVTFTWRRMTPVLQRALWPLDRLGSRPRLAPWGHTLMLIAQRGGGSEGLRR